MAEPVSTIAALGAALIAPALAYLPGAVGAAVSLKFLGDGPSRSQKLISFAAGVACAVYVAPALIEFFSIGGAQVQAGVEFLVGLFALAIGRQLFIEINSADLIGALKRRYFGDRK
ncbi:hypothetical protein ACFDR9_004821 [Janthinobacterium sp. CG_23.3]|uniref:hypothetical protein n=1 Tax=unclassified Janthinobacterium TaxID=2610881 RepID=UPI00034C5EA6|nr:MULTISPECIES: hypothetical protein [unclassified Janthinobacterium]MEC5161842.1 hypothetical protein [Janthinobacterium sp. CG_S6]